MTRAVPDAGTEVATDLNRRGRQRFLARHPGLQDGARQPWQHGMEPASASGMERGPWHLGIGGAGDEGER